MPKIFRAMRSEGEIPALGDNDLGVRVPTDIEPDTQGNVSPGTGGMSVAPSLRLLPAHRVPQRLAGLVSKARGSNTFRIWSMGEGTFVAGTVSDELALRLDPERPKRHGLIEPAQEMGLRAYVMALHETRPIWRLDEGEE